MIGKKLTKTIMASVFVWCFLLPVDGAGGDNRFHPQNNSKINVPMEIELYFGLILLKKHLMKYGL